MMKIIAQPACEARYAMYDVAVNGQKADALLCRVSAMPYNTPWPGYQRPLDQTEFSAFVNLKSSGPVQVSVAVGRPLTDPVVRPSSEKIAVSVQGQTASFTLPGPGQYTFEPDGPHSPLHLFVSPEYELPAVKEDTLYYGPGIHNIGVVELHSGQTVILDDGAVVYGAFEAYGAENVTITGNGILDGSHEVRTSDTLLVPVTFLAEGPQLFIDNLDDLRPYMEEHQVLRGLIRFYQCKNVEVSHITCRDSSTFTIVPAACDGVVVDDVKIVGNWRYNSDGVDLFNTEHCVIRNSYLRCFDDCVVIKGMRGWHTKNNAHILVENCVIWCDWGRALEIGAETYAPEYKDITFRDCDVIHSDWIDLDIQHHNTAYIHDILFDDIRCEYTKYDMPTRLQTDMSKTYEETKDGGDDRVLLGTGTLLGVFFYNIGLFGPGHSGQNVENVIFRNIQVLTDPEVGMKECRFEGLDPENRVVGVSIENLTLNGQKLTTSEAARLYCNEYTEKVTLS